MTAIGSNGECKVIIGQLQSHIKHHVADKKEASLLSEFAQRFFASSAVEDLHGYSTENLFAILVSMWEFIKERRATEAKIRIFNPELKKDGWESKHTIIQISHDDIPFLVDTIRMAIANYEYEIHFIIHFGGFRVKRDGRHHIT